MEKVRCIPAYWAFFVPMSSLLRKYDTCSLSQYGFIKELIQKNFDHPDYFLNISQLYTNPCTKMTRLVVKEDTRSRLSMFQLKFEYRSDGYLEIKNKQAFTNEMFLSSVGGYVGK